MKLQDKKVAIFLATDGFFEASEFILALKKLKKSRPLRCILYQNKKSEIKKLG